MCTAFWRLALSVITLRQEGKEEIHTQLELLLVFESSCNTSEDYMLNSDVTNKISCSCSMVCICS
jgi:hypothetical protein